MTLDPGSAVTKKIWKMNDEIWKMKDDKKIQSVFRYSIFWVAWTSSLSPIWSEWVQPIIFLQHKSIIHFYVKRNR